MTAILDLNGPQSQPFQPWPDAWVQAGIIARFDAVAGAQPDHLALDDGAQRLTYAAVATRARALACRIAADCPAGAIGILQPHSAAFWVAILACVGAGRSYVALDLHHPASRNADILRDAGLAAVIVPPEFDTGAQVVPVDLPRLAWSLAEPVSQALPWPCHAPPAEDVATAVLYTSGSTGRPKGIANNQQALLQRVAQYVNACHLHAGDRMLTLSSPCTIAGTREGLTALLIGATLHVLDAQQAGLGDIARRIHQARITICNAVPSLLRALMSGPDAAAGLRSLRVIRVGGEVVFWTDIALFRRVLPPDCFIQIGYSSTEATGTQWFVPADAVPSGPFVPVGYVLPGNVARVVDDADRPVAAGETGELVLHSRFIALGTWQLGQCVPGSMVPDPAQPGARVLHTGDLAHVDAAGVVTVTGRKDRQVKINGVRVEPSEVEAALRGRGEIADAAVIARRSDKAVSLAAFVVPRPERRDLTAVELRRGLQAILQPAMRPARLYVVEAIPRLPSGKLDVRALQQMDQLPEVDAPTASAPDPGMPDTLMLAVQHSWRAVLGRRSLEEEQSFEAAGGDSLKLLQFVLWLETLLDRRLPLDWFSSEMRPADVVAAITGAALQTGDAAGDRRPTVFLCPGLDGDEPRLAQFRTALRDRIRFVMIEYPDWPDLVRRGRRFDAMVDLAVSQITAAQPAGELLLAGYSFGGDVAFAAAGRLAALGRRLVWLGVLDTDLENLARTAASQPRVGLPKGRQLLTDTAYDRLHAMAGFVLAKCARDIIGVERSLRHAARWRPWLPARTAFAFDRRMRTILRLQARWQWHRDAALPGVAIPAVLFRSSDHAADAADDLGWRARCPLVTVEQVGGDHRSMLDPPHRAALCERFATAVMRAAAQAETARA